MAEHTVLSRLLRDPDVAIQTVTYGLLRNIACNHVNDIELVIRGIGEARLFALIEGALHSNNPALLLEHVSRMSRGLHLNAHDGSPNIFAGFTGFTLLLPMPVSHTALLDSRCSISSSISPPAPTAIEPPL